MKTKLTVWNLIFLNIAIVASLQQLPSTAIFGSSVIFLYLIAAVTFFIPTILMTLFFTEHFEESGGSFLWVNAAFGQLGGFFAVCNQWLSNLVWYPTIFSLIAAFIAYLFDPSLANQKPFILSIQLVAFWSITFLNFLGVKVSTLFSDLCAIFGIFIPILLSGLLASLYLVQRDPSQISFHLRDLVPSVHHFSDISYMIQIIVSLIGIEMSAVHAGNVIYAKESYRRALGFSSFLTLLLLIGGSLAIAIVVPNQKISVVSGLVEAFTDFFSALHLDLFLKPTLFAILLGTLGTVTAWMLTSTRAMQIGSTFCQLPPFFQKTNRYGSPVGILLLECFIFTFMVVVFYAMPSVSAGFWLLIVVASQATLVYYILLFLTALMLSWQKKAPLKRALFYFWMILGILTSLVAIGIGFIPPKGQVAIENHAYYIFLVAIGMAALLVIPFAIYYISILHQEKSSG